MKATEKQKKYMKEYSLRPEVREKRLKYMRDYYQKYQIENKDKIKEKNRKYYTNNKEKVDNYNKKWMANNKAKFRKYLDGYYSKIENKQKMRKVSQEWYETTDKVKYNLRKNNWAKNRMKIDPHFRISRLLHSRVISAFNHFTETGKIRKSKDYGIDYEKIIEHLIKTLPLDFNQKVYEIDHIIACCLWDLNDSEQIKKCFAPENHQWLSKEEHRIKTNEDINKFIELKRKEVQNGKYK